MRSKHVKMEKINIFFIFTCYDVNFDFYIKGTLTFIKKIPF